DGGGPVGVGVGLLVGLGDDPGRVRAEEVGERGVDVGAAPVGVLVGGDAVADGTEGAPVAGVAEVASVGPDGSDGVGDHGRRLRVAVALTPIMIRPPRLRSLGGWGIYPQGVFPLLGRRCTSLDTALACATARNT